MMFVIENHKLNSSYYCQSFKLPGYFSLKCIQSKIQNVNGNVGSVILLVKITFKTTLKRI